jgi:hypothetical protein
MIDDYNFSAGPKYIGHSDADGHLDYWHEEGQPCWACESLAWAPKRRSMVVTAVDAVQGVITLGFPDDDA